MPIRCRFWWNILFDLIQSAQIRVLFKRDSVHFEVSKIFQVRVLTFLPVVDKHTNTHTLTLPLPLSLSLSLSLYLFLSSVFLFRAWEMWEVTPLVQNNNTSGKKVSDTKNLLLWVWFFWPIVEGTAREDKLCWAGVSKSQCKRFLNKLSLLINNHPVFSTKKHAIKSCRVQTQQPWQKWPIDYFCFDYFYDYEAGVSKNYVICQQN